MADIEFEVDDSSVEEARDVTAALRNAHRRIDRVDFLGLEADVARSLTLPLDDIAEDIPVGDVRADVEDFALLAAVARATNGQIPVLLLGEGRSPVCVLPSGKAANEFRRTGAPAWALDPWDLVMRGPGHDAVDLLTSSDGALVEQRPLEAGQQMFFEGLSSYLAVRIAGVRWKRRNTHRPSSPPGFPMMSASAPASAVGGNASGQWWTTHTQTKGLSLYYGGTHAVRNPPNYLGASTTPLPVFLPVGTLHLAADAGPNGAYVWDPAIVTVPSVAPIFTTRRF